MSSLATPVDGAFRKVTARETVILLTLAWLVPFLVHLVPWAGARPLGAYLLPMFWATFAAVYLYGAGTGLLVGLFAPAVNLLVTGLPSGKALGLMALELAVFTLVVAWAVRRAPRWWILAPLGYLAAKLVVTLLQLIAFGFGGFEALRHSLVTSFIGGAAGMVVLTAINFALVKLDPKPAAPAR